MDYNYTVRFVCNEKANTVEMGMFQLMYSREYVKAYNMFCDISSGLLDNFNKEHENDDWDTYCSELKKAYEKICSGINKCFGRRQSDDVHFEIFTVDTDAGPGSPLFGMNVFGKVYSFVLEKEKNVA